MFRTSIFAVMLLSAATAPTDPFQALCWATEDVAGTLTLQGRWEAAAALVEPVLSLARERGDARREARLGVALGRAWLELATHRGESYDRPEAAVEQALRRADVSGDASTRGAALDELARVHYWRRLSDGGGADGFDRAEALFREAVAVREKAGDVAGAAESLFHVGVIHERRRAYDEAARLYTQALERAERAGDKLTMSYAIRHLGFHEARAGRPDAALELHLRSLELRETVGFRIGAAFARVAAGDVLLSKGQNEAAHAHYAAALAVCEALGSLRGTALALLSQAEAWGAGGGDVDRQVDCYTKALAASERMRFRAGEREALDGLAAVFEKRGDLAQARSYRERTARVGAR